MNRQSPGLDGHIDGQDSPKTATLLAFSIAGTRVVPALVNLRVEGRWEGVGD